MQTAAGILWRSKGLILELNKFYHCKRLLIFKNVIFQDVVKNSRKFVRLFREKNWTWMGPALVYAWYMIISSLGSLLVHSLTELTLVHSKTEINSELKNLKKTSDLTILYIKINQFSACWFPLNLILIIIILFSIRVVGDYRPWVQSCGFSGTADPRRCCWEHIPALGHVWTDGTLCWPTSQSCPYLEDPAKTCNPKSNNLSDIRFQDSPFVLLSRITTVRLGKHAFSWL